MNDRHSLDILQFWGDRYGVVTDPFGYSWSFSKPSKRGPYLPDFKKAKPLPETSETDTEKEGAGAGAGGSSEGGNKDANANADADAKPAAEGEK